MTETKESEIILEPGDPGYVAPTETPVPEPTTGQHGPPGQDLTHPRLPGENDGDYLLRTRGMIVDSKSPTDIVPNTPQITMSAPPVPEPETEPEAV